MKIGFRKFIYVCAALSFFGIASLFSIKPANACCSCFATTSMTASLENATTISIVNQHVTDEMIAHRSWILSSLWEDNLLPALQLMTDELTTAALQQTMITGTMMDAQIQMDTQRLLHQKQAEAHKDFHPSESLCEMGSGARSLASSERIGETNAVAMSQRFINRQLGTAGMASAQGPDTDKESRMALFINTFCDPADNNGGLRIMCNHGGGLGAADPTRMNKDIDYSRTVDYPLTLEGNLTDAALSPAEQEIFALADNLYGHNIPVRVDPGSLQTIPDKPMTNIQKSYLDMRSVIAKRSVAKNSFNAIVGMKMSGTAEAQPYLLAMVEALGDTDNPISASMSTAPSYHAQMEILTKKIYQNPTFFTNLYDKPANVVRKQAAMQATGLMQRFDTFKSHLRTEANIAVLLELSLIKLQRTIENEVNPATGQGRPG